MRLDYFMASLSIFFLGIIVALNFVADVNTTYGVNADAQLTNSEIYDRLNETYELSRDIEGKVDTNIESSDTANSMFVGAFGAMRLAWNTFGTFGVMVEEVAALLGIPDYFVLTALAVLVILVAFGIISLVLRIVSY